MLSISRWRRPPSMTNSPIIKTHQRQICLKVDVSSDLTVSAIDEGDSVVFGVIFPTGARPGCAPVLFRWEIAVRW